MVDQVCQRLNQLSTGKLEKVKAHIAKIEKVHQLMSKEIITKIGVETLVNMKTVEKPEQYSTLREESPHLLASIKDTNSSSDLSLNEYTWLWPAAKGMLPNGACFLAVWFRTGKALFHELFFKMKGDWVSSKICLTPRKDSYSLYICPGLKMSDANWKTLKDLLEGKKPGGRVLLKKPLSVVSEKWK